MRRIQRFLSGYSLNLDLVARMIFSLLPVNGKIVLSMDRTNWKFGKFDIKILMLGITYKNVAFPILFKLMPKRGISKWTERKELVESFIRLFGKDYIDCLVTDREFVGKEWVGWLNNIKLRYYLRVRKNFKVAKGSSKTETKVIHLVCHLKVGKYACSSCRYNLKGNMVYIVGAHFRASNGVADYQILICFDRPQEGVETYKKRWQIETLIKGLKSS